MGGSIQTRFAVIMETPPTVGEASLRHTAAAEEVEFASSTSAKAGRASRERPDGGSGWEAGITQTPGALQLQAPAEFTAQTLKATREAGCRLWSSK